MDETNHFLDEIIDRRNTNSVKWDVTASTAVHKDLLPMWVADMDFRVPEAVQDAVRKTAEHGIFGYTRIPVNLWQTVSSWTGRRYNWEIETGWLSYTSGIITGLNVSIQTFTRPGEKVVIRPPVYPPFHKSVIANGRQLVHNDLVKDSDGKYHMDLDHLESVIDEETRMLILCNPHNPVGRSWTENELRDLARICLKYNLLVFSDEIHADLLLDDRRHCSFASLDSSIADRTITGIAPSKTFNIAGLKASIIVTPNDELRRAFDRAQQKTFGLYNANTFAVVAMQSAYAYGDRWLEEVLAYLKANRDFALDFLAEELPGVSVGVPEATFLMWLDFSTMGLSHEEINHRLMHVAGVVLNDGRSFGASGDRHFRLNFGCPRETLEAGLFRISGAFC